MPKWLGSRDQLEFYAAELTVGFIAPQWLNVGNFM